MDCKQETPFRIGGHYRQQNGAIVTVIGVREYQGTNPECYPGLRAVELEGGGVRNIYGKCCSFVGTPIPYMHLIPGELTQTPSGWVALGAEKQEESDLPELLKHLLRREQRKVDPSPADARMIARDGPARIAIPKPLRLTVRVQSTAKPNPFKNYTAPDCSSVPDHLNASRHQMAGMSKS